MPKKVAMAFEILSRKVQIYHSVLALAKPLDVERHLLVARRMAHPAGNNKFADLFVTSDKNLVGSEHHVLEVPDRVNRFHFQPGFLQGAPQVLPLMLCTDTKKRGGQSRTFRGISQ